MNAHTDSSRLYHGGAEKLRSEDRLARLEVPRVVGLCLSGIQAASVLDLGTGTGVFAEAFLAAGVPSTGIDLNPDFLALARTLVPQAIFLEARADDLPCDDGAHDLVFIGLLLHEVGDPLAVLREARRVARLRVAILEWPWKDGTKGPPLEHRMKPDQIAALAREAGFTRTETIDLTHLSLYILE